MKSIPNKMVDDLIRYLPVLIGNIQDVSNNTRLHNTIRLTHKIIKQLKRIRNDEKRTDH